MIYPEPDIALQQRFFRVAGYLVIAVISISSIVLLGWQFNIDFFKRPLPLLVAMNPTTAFLFALSGIAYFLLNNKKKTARYNKAGYAVSCIIILVSLLHIIDIAFDLNIRVDRILFYEKLAEDNLANISNHMAPNTSVCFILTGVALFLLHFQTPGKKMPANYFSALVTLLGLFSILGYLYNVPSFYGVLTFIPMAIHTAVCFLLISLAILFSDPAGGIMKLLTGKLIGSITTRLLLPFAVFIPVILGLFRLYGYRLGLFSSEFGSALLVLSIIVVFIGIIWYNARLLNKRDLLRIQVEDKVKQFNEELEEKVKTKTAELIGIFERITDGFIALDKNFCYTYVNKKTGESVHRDPRSLIGKNIWEEFPQEAGSSTYKAFLQAMEKQHYIICIDYYPPLDLWQENHIYPSPEGLSVFIKDISERKKAEETLRSLEREIAEQKLQEQKKVSRAIIKAQEEEKNHIGKELHDNVTQILAGTKLYLGIAANKDAAVKEMLRYPMELIDSSIEEIRFLSSKQVTPLKNIDLEKLVHDLLDTLGKNGMTKTGFSYSISDELLPDDLKLNIYRVLQVQVNNIIKHADAKNVDLSIKKQNNAIEIIMTDDGMGFDLSAQRKGIGISNMLNRIETYNGEIEMKSSPGNGCRIKVIIPLQ